MEYHIEYLLYTIQLYFVSKSSCWHHPPKLVVLHIFTSTKQKLRFQEKYVRCFSR